MAKYKVGDKVIVRTDLDENEEYDMDDGYDYWFPEEEMVKLGGNTVTIKVVNRSYYIVEELDNYKYRWTCDMFVGLAEEERKYKFKVGDMVIGNESANKRYSITKQGWIGTVTEVIESRFTAKGEGSGGAGFYLDYSCFDLYEREVSPKAIPEPTPTTVNFNITVNLYENACWYCRKGGLVDLYLAGAMGICPSCGRVCNDTRGVTLKKDAIETPKRENKPLTTEELEALPDGARVFVVWCSGGNGVETWDDNFTCWRIKKGKLLHRESGKGRVDFREHNHKSINAYLEEPKRPS